MPCPFSNKRSHAVTGSNSLWQGFIILFALSTCLAASLYAPVQWIRAICLAIAVCIGVAILLQIFTNLLYILVDRQRWKYRLWDESGKTLRVPNSTIQGEDVKRIFGHPDVTGKASNGLRQLIRWWHAPSAECHQESMDRNDLYNQLRPVTVRLLAMPLEEAQKLAFKHVDEAMKREESHDDPWSITRLRAFVSPISVSFCYECIFKQECPPEIVSLLGASTADVLTATGAMKGRNMPLREKALAHIKSVLEQGSGRPDVFGEDCMLSIDHRAKYLQSVWIHTATAQIARLICNTLFHLARNRRCLEIVKKEMASNGFYIDAVILESMRLTPGVPSTNRVATKDVTIGEHLSFHSDTNFVFDLERYHRTGFDSPDEFIPERWHGAKKKELNYMPFGVGKQRCPAEPFTLVIAKTMILRILTSLDIHAPIGFGMLFSTKPQIANDLCCIIRRPSLSAMKIFGIRCRLSAVLSVENVQKSFTQLRVMPINAKDAFDEDESNRKRGFS